MSAQRARTLALRRLLSNQCTGNGFSRPQSALYKIFRPYAQPANFDIPTKVAYRPPPPPSTPPKIPQPSSETVPQQPDPVQLADSSFDDFLNQLAVSVCTSSATGVDTLYSQYRARAATVLDLIVPYEERPGKHRRADYHAEVSGQTPVDTRDGDGIVMVVYAMLKPNGKLDKVCACSGFAINAEPKSPRAPRHDVVVTCAHTLEEMHRNIKSAQSPSTQSFSFVISNNGEPRRVNQILSSMPKSDVVVMELEAAVASSTPSVSPARLRTLPLSPYPVQSGGVLLTHIFGGSSNPPDITLSQCRLPKTAVRLGDEELHKTQEPRPWLKAKAWRRMGVGVMLGYRSYTGTEVEAGIHSSLPHMLTSVLPTPGSSGGPLVCGETGAVVGMISGRRMDNRVEGERGWGTSAESIFEMFSLPGFAPTALK